MGQLDGGTVSAILIGLATFLTFLVSQSGARARAQRARLKHLTRRDIAWSAWGHRVKVWAAAHGHEDLPPQPSVLSEENEDEA